ncbi:hypothetical protein P3342_011776 [Pyrenophora teres f. teres]|nr:hypothetical protein PTNB85_10367 [Pyrenophora teres f. teres]KAK1911174.1 hypothetical protein P3342_011776 [Pyrenophora teres f. teres]
MRYSSAFVLLAASAAAMPQSLVLRGLDNVCPQYSNLFYVLRDIPEQISNLNIDLRIVIKECCTKAMMEFPEIRDPICTTLDGLQKPTLDGLQKRQALEVMPQSSSPMALETVCPYYRYIFDPLRVNPERISDIQPEVRFRLGECCTSAMVKFPGYTDPICTSLDGLRKRQVFGATEAITNVIDTDMCIMEIKELMSTAPVALEESLRAAETCCGLDDATSAVLFKQTTDCIEAVEPYLLL